MMEHELTTEIQEFPGFFQLPGGYDRLEHWCGLEIGIYFRNQEEKETFNRTVAAYVATLTPEEKLRRQTLFAACRDAYLFQSELRHWIEEKILTAGGTREAQLKYVTAPQGAVVTADDLTSAVPQAMRDRFAHGKKAIAAWLDLKARLGIYVECRTHVTMRVVEKENEHGR